LAPLAVASIRPGLLGIAGIGLMLTLGSEAVFNESTELFDDLEYVVLVRWGLEDLNASLLVSGVFIQLPLKNHELHMNLAEGDVFLFAVNRFVEDKLTGLGEVFFCIAIPFTGSSLDVNNANVPR
jgi:hypothetical protein